MWYGQVRVWKLKMKFNKKIKTKKSERYKKFWDRNFKIF